DEIAYLKAEFKAMASTLAARFPDAAQRWGLVLYRDVGAGDLYTVRSFPFTADVNEFQSEIAAQSADGGGDYPESPELGLQEAAKLAWRPDATARVLFWVGDAPHHVGHEGTLLEAVLGLRN